VNAAKKQSQFKAKQSQSSAPKGQTVTKTAGADTIPISMEFKGCDMFPMKTDADVTTLLIGAILLTGVFGSAADGALKGGCAKVDITPPIGIWLSGYGSRDKPSDGISDKLYAKALVLDDGQNKIAIVSADLLCVPISITTEVRKNIQEKIGIPETNILICTNLRSSVLLNYSTHYPLFTIYRHETEAKDRRWDQLFKKYGLCCDFLNFTSKIMPKMTYLPFPASYAITSEPAPAPAALLVLPGVFFSFDLLSFARRGRLDCHSKLPGGLQELWRRINRPPFPARGLRLG
jgi:hypothetical protein